ncbi:MAG TPA: DUF5658 family protein [Planctomycetota bacterium]|nr:DUF5658 family protein [Planctomycetota bacterium]
MEQRRLPDRRRRRTPALSRRMLTGRRRGGRRAGERKDIYVDRYRPWEGALVLLVVAMCAMDLLLTLDVIQRGGEEWNPVMRVALDLGVWPFVVIKLAITAVGALVLLLRVRFRGMRVVLVGLTLLYALLMGWHAVLRGEGPDRTAAAAEAPP